MKQFSVLTYGLDESQGQNLRAAGDPSLAFIEASDWSDFQTRTRDLSPALILVSGGAKERILETLHFVRAFARFSAHIFVSHENSADVLQDIINTGAVDRITDEMTSLSEVKDLLAWGLQLHDEKQKRHHVLRDATASGRMLDELNRNLEDVVSERVENESRAKEAAEIELKRERALVRFITDLGAINNLEDHLVLLTAELRSFSNVLGPVIRMVRADRDDTLYYVRGRQLIERTVPRPSEERVSWANAMGRPTGTLTKMAELTTELNFLTVEVWIEHSAELNRWQTLEDFMQPRLQPFLLTLERLIVEREMREISKQWEVTFDGIRDPIAIVDLERNVLRANRPYIRHFGKSCHRVYFQMAQPCDGCPLIAAIETEMFQERALTVNGRQIEVQSFPIKVSESEKPTTAIHLYRDLTEARTEQGRIFQNEKMMLIGSLAGQMAHELNNPLTGIRSLAQILRTEVESGGQLSSDLGEVERAAERCQALIENLMSFSSRSVPSPHATIDLNELVNKTLPMLKTALRSHRTRWQLADEPLAVAAEPHLIQQVIFNLINNACQALPDEGGVIAVATRRRGDGMVEFSVKDSGPGVPPAQRETIFEPFFTTKAKGHGTGLGLSMSRQIIESFGGQLSLVDHSDPGAMFQFVLPAGVINASADR